MNATAQYMQNASAADHTTAASHTEAISVTSLPVDLSSLAANMMSTIATEVTSLPAKMISLSTEMTPFLPELTSLGPEEMTTYGNMSEDEGRAVSDEMPFLDRDPYHAIPYIVALCTALVGE